jgi:hypothetical protein
VPMTSSMNQAKLTDSKLRSSLPASIFELELNRAAKTDDQRCHQHPLDSLPSRTRTGSSLTPKRTAAHCVTVASEPGKGSVFTVRLPAGAT